MSNGARTDAAVFYVADGYDTNTRQLMGRRAAGEAFLKALAQDPAGGPLVCCTPAAGGFDGFRKHVRALGAPADRPLRHVVLGDHAGLAAAGCVFYPGPDIAKLAWARAAGDPRGHSLTGVTHTTASHGAMDHIAGLLGGPLEAWDALICTSRSVRTTVEQVLGVAFEQAAARGERPRPPQAQLPVIPLGIDCAGLAPGPAAGASRAGFRARYGIGADDLVVLSLARTSYHGKAHPLPMYLALQAVAAMPGRGPLHLLQTGWFANDAIEQHFRAAAAALCPDVAVHFVPGTDPDVRSGIWHAADIFSLMSDNIQETFGLAPLEAMAAGLPVVASDWNGFRETVRHGVDGFLARTAMPAAGAGADLALRHDIGVDSYDRYIGGASQATAVSIADAIAGFAALADGADLRRSMGAAGMARARAEFDWPVVLGQYRALWSELAARRAGAMPDSDPPVPVPPLRPPHPVNPARDDPFRSFACYPSVALDRDTPLRLAAGAGEPLLRERAALAMNSFAAAVLPAGAQFAAMLHALGRGDATAGAVLDRAEVAFAPGLRGLGWLAKMGLVEIGDGRGGWF
ncbi:MAG: glycosyltransferase family 4 protein [Alphaproteobacteria bacterium]